MIFSDFIVYVVNQKIRAVNDFDARLVNIFIFPVAMGDKWSFYQEDGFYIQVSSVLIDGCLDVELYAKIVGDLYKV